MRLSHLVAAAAFSALIASAPTTRADDPPTAQACVKARGEARYLGFAYDHWVHLSNECKRPVSCRVTTDRNPEPVDASVPAQTSVAVLTYRASTTASFSFQVHCEFTSE